jgi:hypothetical protein
MTVTLANLLDDIDNRLEDWPQEGGASVGCDGAATMFHLPDRFIVNDATFEASVISPTGGIDTLGINADYTMNFNTGWLTLQGTYASSPPASGYTLDVNYTHKHWPRALQQQILSDGLSYLFPAFYAIHEVSPSALDLQTSGEYLVHSSGNAAIAVQDVEYSYQDSVSLLRPNRDYRVIKRDGATALRLFATKPSEEYALRVRGVFRPEPFDELTEDLASKGLPESMRSCLVYYACWKLLAQKVMPLMRRDLVSSFDGEARTTFNDQMNGLNMYRNMLELEIARTKMAPWTAKGI